MKPIGRIFFSSLGQDCLNSEASGYETAARMSAVSGERRDAEEAGVKFVSILFISPTVYDAVREGHQTMSNMENHGGACATGSTRKTRPLSAGLGSRSLCVKDKSARYAQAP